MRSKLKLLALVLPPMLSCCGSPVSQAPSPILSAPPAQPSTTTQKGTGGIDPLCASLSPVSLSHEDTEGTKQQVIVLNAIIDKACGAAK